MDEKKVSDLAGGIQNLFQQMQNARMNWWAHFTTTEVVPLFSSTPKYLIEKIQSAFLTVSLASGIATNSLASFPKYSSDEIIKFFTDNQFKIVYDFCSHMGDKVMYLLSREDSALVFYKSEGAWVVYLMSLNKDLFDKSKLFLNDKDK